MALEKAYIKPEGADKITVLFNPTDYGLDRSNQFADIGIPGLSAPIVQYVRGSAATLNMRLMLDTYEQQTDVSVETNKIYGLLGINRDTHAPPICTFTWGKFHFQGVLERVNGRFTLFLANGTPVRATLDVVFKQYIDVDKLVRVEPTQSADRVKTRTLVRGDTLSSVAAMEYGDPAQWRPIAVANHIDNPRQVAPGDVLVIPALT